MTARAAQGTFPYAHRTIAEVGAMKARLRSFTHAATYRADPQAAEAA